MDISVSALLRVRDVYEQLDLPLPKLLGHLPEAGWLAVDDPQAWLRDPQGNSLPLAMRFHLGSRILDNWYHRSDGFTLCPTSVQVLRHHAKPDGYGRLVKGAAKEIGDFRLIDLDEAAGSALIHSSTPFCREWERGMVQGALDAAGDLLYSEVRWVQAQSAFEVRFVCEDNRSGIGWALGEPEEPKVWRLRNRVRQLEQRNAYLDACGHLPKPQTAERNVSSGWLDPITGAVAEEELAERLHVCAQSPLPPALSLVVYAVDGPHSNDQQRQLSLAGQRATRRHDLLANLGEDGLALLLHEVDEASAQRIAQRMADDLQPQLVNELLIRVLPWQGGAVGAFLAKAKAALQAGHRYR
jgi:hypothetical protein